MDKRSDKFESRNDRDNGTDQSEIRSYTSEQLFAGTREVKIEHDGQIYYLHITRQNKLILTK